MELKENSDVNLWENFIAKNQQFNFLQSRFWGQILEKEKRDVKYWEIWKRKKLIGIFLMEKKSLARGFSYSESLWGPVWLRSLIGEKVTDLTRELFKLVSKEEKSIFWRLSPPAGALISPKNSALEFYFEPDYKKIDSGLEPQDFFPTLARTRPPKKTLIIDLSQDEKEILAQMKGKTRYNINLAKKKNLKIVWSRDRKKLKDFWRLNVVTSRRNGFKPHSFPHYLSILEVVLAGEKDKKNQAELILAYHNNKVISANLILFFNETVYYLHGASSNESRNLMSTYLLHWETISRAKKEGYLWYDFWGIDQNKWPGVTRFKESFGGQKKDYPSLYELPFKNYYYKLYRIYKRLR